MFYFLSSEKGNKKAPDIIYQGLIVFRFAKNYFVCETGIFTLSKTDDSPRLETFIVMIIHVTIITAATIAVSFVIVVAELGAEKILSLLELPKIPAIEPLPLCKSTSKIKNKQARI